MKSPRLSWAALILSVVAGATSTAVAQTPFYQGKQLTILNNFASGGPNDIEARLLARHLAKHISGHPTIVIQDKEGAGGLVGTKYLGEVAPKDGSMMGYLTGASWKYIVEPDKHPVDFRTYEFLASVSGNAVYYMRADTAPGIKQGVDLAKAQDVVAGGVSPDASKDLRIRLTLDMLGVPYRYVSGYRGAANARLALQRGEINLFSESTPGYLTVVEPTLIKTGVTVPLFYDPDSDGASLRRLASMEERSIPSFPDFYRSIKGTAPSGPLWDVYSRPLAVDNAMLRTIVMPPGAPQLAVDALRAALASLNDDRDFAADAFKTIQFVPRYETGADINARARQALTVSPEIRAFVLDYLKRGTKM
jgi:tripartite-type tricarboxylate transporter receptor subunit TctC